MAGPHPAVAAARTAVRAALAQVSAGPVLVACSGGADSLALAVATAFVAPRAGRTAGAVVVDHAWTPGSAAVAGRAAQQCRGLGLDPVEVVPLPAAAPAGPDGGPEAAAREGRYAALAAACARHGAVAVLAGHTLDDQAESVLLGLARGSGGRSLAGMGTVRRLPVAGPADAVVPLLVRPFLGLRRERTEEVCRQAGLEPWTDPANTDPAYARARVRAAAALLSDLLGPGLPEALARTADLLREDVDALDAAALDLLAAALAAAATDGGGPQAGPQAGPLALDVAVLAAAPDAVRRRALLVAARRAGCPAGALARRHVLALDALVVAWRGQGEAHLPGHVTGRRVCGRLLLATGTR
ncbi:tRNA lysidine(34) synthetase TilS [Kineosporia sp. R_H_3]|uniref:tRNA lysidine(34) synthetase TilS n=1 Tax=Kineosporia sp. R_H_3 TaxID=1961848 RepID=UPI000B4BAEE4|nr:tRNA lysidine(34) synthetase TilS [Kineosporia sp. R_H_3]